MPNRNLNNMRESYDSSFLLEEYCDKNPFVQFEKWFQDSVNDKQIEPNAMQLATVGKDLQPSIRTVLLKSFDANGFVFYTNYHSKKGNEIEENGKVSLLFWYREHQRQIRIEGVAHKTEPEENDIYFHSRPRGSQLAALVSEQSKTIKDRNELDELFKTKSEEYKDLDIPLKENWGGYIITPTLFEFWQGRESRLHDRIQYTRTETNDWKIERLCP